PVGEGEAPVIGACAASDGSASGGGGASLRARSARPGSSAAGRFSPRPLSAPVPLRVCAEEVPEPASRATSSGKSLGFIGGLPRGLRRPAFQGGWGAVLPGCCLWRWILSGPRPLWSPPARVCTTGTSGQTRRGVRRSWGTSPCCFGRRSPGVVRSSRGSCLGSCRLVWCGPAGRRPRTAADGDTPPSPGVAAPTGPRAAVAGRRSAVSRCARARRPRPAGWGSRTRCPRRPPQSPPRIGGGRCPYFGPAACSGGSLRCWRVWYATGESSGEVGAAAPPRASSAIFGVLVLGGGAGGPYFGSIQLRLPCLVKAGGRWKWRSYVVGIK
ncbi:unnamed protein product, partial [Ixodes pacificus]